MTLKLYYFPTSHWSRSVSMVIEELGLSCTREVVDITKNANYDPTYIQLNPRGVVPTLIDEDTVYWDSRVIVRHLDRKYAAGELWASRDETTQAWITKLHNIPMMLLSYSVWVLGKRGEKSADILADKVARAHRYAEQYPHLESTYLRKAAFFDQFSRELHDPQHVASAVETTRILLEQLREQVRSRRWVAGDVFSFADCMAASVLSRLVDLRLLNFWYAKRSDRLRAYLERLRARDSYRFVFHSDPQIPEHLRLRMP